LLWQIIRKEFKRNLKVALVSLIDQHPAGWSSLADRSCYCHPKQSKRPEFKNRKPEPEQIFTEKNVVTGDTDIEWLFAFDEERKRLCVRDVQHGAESLVELEDARPNWEVIECGEEFERCGHYAWFHKLLPKTSNLSTQVWLGNRPFEFHDAVAFLIDGKRLKSTGSGGNSDYLQRATGRKLPRNTWVSSVIAGNGKRLEVPVAQILPGGLYTPLPGVTFVYPPMKVNPNETLVSA
jgi:hypothetical protein